ncbi:MAG: tRNA (adenosine(37)-N6)-threonylcarbamoyltransferase complex dimerization subunit type 1 TsaB [bacterium]|nr:tRNA (adenosine(37)-N6)-threonylcarbamoyltransferase complex dimerization subunit type 1 TsaB [bacterium]
MKILAVETSGLRESVAVYNNGKITELNQEVKSHSSHLLRAIDKVLKKSDTRLEDLDCLAASTGPGSFMGIRIGLGTMQGLSLALDIPLIGIPALDAVAENVRNSGLDLNNIKYICPLILSKGEEVYSAVYIVKNRQFKRKSKFQYISINEFLKIFRKDKISGCVIFFSEARRFESQIINVLGEKAVFLQDKISFPGAGNIAKLAGKNIRNNKTKKSVYPSPLYVRPYLTKKTG